MQEWIIAMLVISGLLVLRDMAKTVFSGNSRRERELLPLYREHPQKQRVEQYAESFQKLADTFGAMPYRRETLGREQREQILHQCHDSLCTACYQRELCWQSQGKQSVEGFYTLLDAIEDGGAETIHRARAGWMGQCSRSGQFFEEAFRCFRREKERLIWDNRIAESRLAAAEQLLEMSRIMKRVAGELYEIGQAPEELSEDLSRRLKRRHIVLYSFWMPKREEGRCQAFLHMRARSGQCVTVQEIAEQLSEVCGRPMAPAPDSRCIVNGEPHTVQFFEEAGYQMLYGVAKVTKEEEKVSGDNYSCRLEESGRFLMCLSDGMGSGLAACRESEVVVELLEQFLDAGFSQETAARLVNSALVLQHTDECFSTLDLCAVDLYTGICSFLKAGAATTFIKRDHWVEAISSTSPAVGLVQQMEYETASRKLYHGDYLIMVTDGVLDALPEEAAEETMKEIILDTHRQTPKELGRDILGKVLGYSDYAPRDDMTVLVAGMWKK